MTELPPLLVELAQAAGLDLAPAKSGGWVAIDRTTGYELSAAHTAEGAARMALGVLRRRLDELQRAALDTEAKIAEAARARYGGELGIGRAARQGDPLAQTLIDVNMTWQSAAGGDAGGIPTGQIVNPRRRGKDDL